MAYFLALKSCGLEEKSIRVLVRYPHLIHTEIAGYYDRPSSRFRLRKLFVIHGVAGRIISL
jgi:hypothetical protein